MIWRDDFFFFFKQKTAYEMRISDWSSDVCSSDLRSHHPDRRGGRRGPPSGLVGRRIAAAVQPAPRRAGDPPEGPRRLRPGRPALPSLRHSDPHRPPRRPRPQHLLVPDLPTPRLALEDGSTEPLGNLVKSFTSGSLRWSHGSRPQDRGGRCGLRGSEEHTSELQPLMRHSYAVFS